MDEKFLAECLKAFNPILRKINMTDVAHAMSYTNSKSAKNRWGALKKKHNINVPTYYGPLKSESKANEADDTPETPTMSPVKSSARSRKPPAKALKAKATQQKLSAKKAAPETSEDELEDTMEDSDDDKPRKAIAAEAEDGDDMEEV